MTIAVTGATGALGSLTLAALARTEPVESLVALVRDREKAAGLTDQGFDVRVASYDDRAALDRALQGVDTVVLVSGSEVGRRVAQHSAVIDAATSAGVGRLIYTSAPRADTTDLVLAPEHRATEAYLASSGLDHTIARNNWYHENYAQQIEMTRATGTLVAAAGDGRVASASRADFADGLAALAVSTEHSGAVLELAGDVAWTHDDLAAALGQVVGREVVYQPVEADALVSTLVEVGLDEATARFVAALDTNIAAGDLDVDDRSLSTLIGRPTTPLVDGLRALA